MLIDFTEDECTTIISVIAVFVNEGCYPLRDFPCSKNVNLDDLVRKLNPSDAEQIINKLNDF